MGAREIPQQWAYGRLFLTSTADAEASARALAQGAVVGHGFANFYAITTRPDAETIQAVNALKGRPTTQVGSVTTTPSRIADVWDLSKLPPDLTRYDVHSLLDALFTLGPFGFRGPAADSVPEHLAQYDGVRTTQVIAPGYDCPSNDFLTRCLRNAGTAYLYVTSANRSRHQTGATDEPAHFRASGLRTEFGSDPRFLLLEHVDEESARRNYPDFAPMSTTILALHRLGPGVGGRRSLVLERHGSLSVEKVREVVAPLGFDVVLGTGVARLSHACPPTWGATRRRSEYKTLSECFRSRVSAAPRCQHGRIREGRGPRRLVV